VDDDYTRSRRVLGVGEAAARVDVATIHIHPVRSVDLHPGVHLLVLVGELCAATEVRRDSLDHWETLDRRRLVDCQCRIPTFRARLVRPITRLEPTDRPSVDVERRRTSCLEI